MNTQDMGIVAIIIFGVLAIIIPVVILRWALMINQIVNNLRDINHKQDLIGQELEKLNKKITYLETVDGSINKTNKLLSDFLNRIQ